MNVKSESEVAQSCRTLRDPMDCSLPGSSSMGVSRQEYWSGVPLPSPIECTERYVCCCSVTKSCPILCNQMDCNMPGSSVLHYLLKFAQIHVHPASDAIQPSYPLIPFSCLQSFPASGYFPMSQFFASGGQSMGASASASVLPTNIQD